MSWKITGRVPCPDIRFWHEPDRKLSRFALKKGGPRMEGVPFVYHHSPTGPNWGYEGSGPADAALSILAYCLPVGCDGEGAVKLYKGDCSRPAWTLHQWFKREFIVRVPADGGVILGSAVDAWLDERLASTGPDEGEGAAREEG